MEPPPLPRELLVQRCLLNLELLAKHGHHTFVQPKADELLREPGLSAEAQFRLFIVLADCYAFQAPALAIGYIVKAVDICDRIDAVDEYTAALLKELAYEKLLRASMSFEDDMRAAGEHLMNSQDTGVRNEAHSWETFNVVNEDTVVGPGIVGENL